MGRAVIQAGCQHSLARCRKNALRRGRGEVSRNYLALFDEEAAVIPACGLFRDRHLVYDGILDQHLNAEFSTGDEFLEKHIPASAVGSCQGICVAHAFCAFRAANAPAGRRIYRLDDERKDQATRSLENFTRRWHQSEIGARQPKGAEQIALQELIGADGRCMLGKSGQTEFAANSRNCSHRVVRGRQNGVDRIVTSCGKDRG